MRVIWRLALACLLALVVPLQGFAALVRPACAGADAGTSAMMAASEGMRGPALRHEAGLPWADAQPSSPCHPGMTPALEPSADEGGTLPAAAPTDSPTKRLPCDACSHCAAVGTVLALLPVAAIRLPDPAAQPAWPAPQPLHEPVWPQGLERPPRAAVG